MSEDEYGRPVYIETIKRIGNDRDAFGEFITQKYNPFDERDNASYDENESLSEEELLKTKYWVVLHNGKYYEGDINDPIWAGDRYEIVLFNVQDFREHFEQTGVHAPAERRAFQAGYAMERAFKRPGRACPLEDARDREQGRCCKA